MDKSQYIKIQNFRCFKELEVNGFKRVNLIGGKNNAGKTSLLEALLLYFYPNPNSFKELLQIRKVSPESLEKEPTEAWNNFFYSQDTKNQIGIHGCFKGIGEQTINISVSQSIDTKRFDDNKGRKNNKDYFDSIEKIRAVISTLEIKQEFKK
jgi:AAA15 family ATPase/GTPase